MSFDHDKGEWRSVGTATVSADGKRIVSDPGVGVLAPGWHFWDFLVDVFGPEKAWSKPLDATTTLLLSGANANLNILSILENWVPGYNLVINVPEFATDIFSATRDRSISDIEAFGLTTDVIQIATSTALTLGAVGSAFGVAALTLTGPDKTSENLEKSALTEVVSGPLSPPVIFTLGVAATLATLADAAAGLQQSANAAYALSQGPDPACDTFNPSLTPSEMFNAAGNCLASVAARLTELHDALEYLNTIVIATLSGLLEVGLRRRLGDDFNQYVFDVVRPGKVRVLDRTTGLPIADQAGVAIELLGPARAMNRL